GPGRQLATHPGGLRVLGLVAGVLVGVADEPGGLQGGGHLAVLADAFRLERGDPGADPGGGDLGARRGGRPGGQGGEGDGAGGQSEQSAEHGGLPERAVGSIHHGRRPARTPADNRPRYHGACTLRGNRPRAGTPRKGARRGRAGAVVSPLREAGMTYRDRVAVITGASTGIGYALARALAAEGCKVGLV